MEAEFSQIQSHNYITNNERVMLILDNGNYTYGSPHCCFIMM